MAMFQPIPLPNPSERYKDIFDYFEQVKKRQAQQPLLEAQTSEAQANALKSKMIANVINSAFGLGQPQATNQAQGYTPSQQEQERINNMQPGDSVVVGAGQQGTQPISQGGANGDQGRSVLQALGILHETPGEQEQRETRTAYKKEFASSDAKQLSQWNEKITASHELMPVLENIRDISANPTFQNMYKNPEYFGYDLAWLKRFGKPEEQDLLTQLGTNTKSIFSSLGQEFKGAFREFEYKIFQQATPDETKDTLQQIISKSNTLFQLRDLVTQRLTLADKIVRSSGGQISPASALEIADKQINGKQQRERIQAEFKKSEAEQKALKQNIKKIEKKPGSPLVIETTTLVDPDGGQHIVMSDKVDAALAKYPGLKVLK